MTHHEGGQALAEFAIIAPLLFGLLLAILGAGLFLVAQEAQQSRANAIVGYAAANRTLDVDDYAAGLVDPVCAVNLTFTDADDSGGTYLVLVSCPSWVHRMVPPLPETVTTSGTAYGIRP